MGRPCDGEAVGWGGRAIAILFELVGALGGAVPLRNLDAPAGFSPPLVDLLVDLLVIA
jgi:hypothetical protein